MPFSTIPAALQRALADRAYAAPTPVQTAVLAPGLEGNDLLVSAQTGSGKTVAFGLAMAKALLDDEESFGDAGAPLALIIAPTRELALQVERELQWLYKPAGARMTSCVGGMDPRKERNRLEMGAHIVVGTPGRLRDHLERGGLDLSQLRAVVLDEADEMLDMGFREDLTFILDMTPAERRTLMFSATLPKGIDALARRYQRNAVRLKVDSGERGHADIEHWAVRVAPKQSENVTVNLLRQVEAETSIVFCNTREAVRHMHATLTERGFSAVLLSGELSQHERNQALQAMRDGRARVCVATDVAARGIDLPSLGLVIHAELPHDPEVMQHRSGRTGRAGRKGISALLVTYSGRRKAEALLRGAGLDAQWMGPPQADDIAKKDHERFLADTTLTEPASEDEALLVDSLLAVRTPQEIAVSLVRAYQARLGGVEDVTDPGDFGPTGKVSAREPFDRNAKRWEPETHAEGNGVWFRMTVGRRNRADPKWLLPMLCRRGQIRRGEIGAIRIFDAETHVEIEAASASAFEHNVRAPDEEGIVIERLGDNERGAPAAGPSTPSKGPRPSRSYDDRPPRAHAEGQGEERRGGGGFGKKPFRKDGPDGGGSFGKKPFRKDGPDGGGGFGKKPFRKEGSEAAGGGGFAKKPFRKDGPDEGGFKGKPARKPFRKDY